MNRYFLFWLVSSPLVFMLQSFPGVYDSAELISASASLGIAHPPGQPLYLILSNLMTQIPLGSIPFRIALGSFLCIQGSTYFFLRTIATFRQRPLSHIEFWVFGAALLLFPSVVIQSYRTELYALFTLLFSIQLFVHCARPHNVAYLMIRWVLHALMFQVHTLLAGLIILAELSSYVWDGRRAYIKLWNALPALGIFILTSAVVLYVPIRASLNPTINWGNPDNWGSLLYYLRAADYQRSLASDWWISNIKNMRWIFISGVLLFGAVYQAYRRANAYPQKTFLHFVILCLVYLGLSWIVVPFTPENPDVHGYFQNFCLVYLLIFFSASYQSIPMAAMSQKAIGLSTAAITLFYLSSQHMFLGAPSFARSSLNHLNTSPPRSTFIVSSDHLLFPMWYGQLIEQRGPEQLIVAKGLMPAKWYQEQIETAHRSKIIQQIYFEDPKEKSNLLIDPYFHTSQKNMLRYCRSQWPGDFMNIGVSLCAQHIQNITNAYNQQQLFSESIFLLEYFMNLPHTSAACAFTSEIQLPFDPAPPKRFFLPHPEEALVKLYLLYLSCQTPFDQNHPTFNFKLARTEKLFHLWRSSAAKLEK